MITPRLLLNIEMLFTHLPVSDRRMDCHRLSGFARGGLLIDVGLGTK